MQAGPPQLCCHNPGRSSEHSLSHPDPHLDAWGSIAVHLGIAAPHDFSIPRFWVLAFRWQRFHFPRCRTLLIVAAIRAEHSRSVKLEPPVWLENGDSSSSIPGGERLLPSL